MLFFPLESSFRSASLYRSLVENRNSIIRRKSWLFLGILSFVQCLVRSVRETCLTLLSYLAKMTVN